MLVGATYAGELMQRAHERGFNLVGCARFVQLFGQVGFQQEPVQGDLPCVFAPSPGCKHALTYREETSDVECPRKLIACARKPMEYAMGARGKSVAFEDVERLAC